MDMDKQGLPTKVCWDLTDLKTIKISSGTAFTAEDLLNMFLPFGYVVSVQKMVKNGFTCGVVIYCNVNDAARAMMTLNNTKGFLVSLLQPREVREARQNERSKRPVDQIPCLLHDGFSDMRPQRLPRLQDSLYPPAYSQTVCLRIHNLPKHVVQRYQVLRLLPASTINVKVDGNTALITLLDFSTALWLMDSLNDLYTGPKCLHVSFANQGYGAYPARRAGRRKHHQQYQG